MDEIVKDVKEGWVEDGEETATSTLQYADLTIM